MIELWNGCIYEITSILFTNFTQQKIKASSQPQAYYFTPATKGYIVNWDNLGKVYKQRVVPLCPCQLWRATLVDNAIAHIPTLTRYPFLERLALAPGSLGNQQARVVVRHLGHRLP